MSPFEDAVNDLTTHRDSWRLALEAQIESAKKFDAKQKDPNCSESSYWQHEKRALERTLDILSKRLTWRAIVSSELPRGRSNSFLIRVKNKDKTEVIAVDYINDIFCLANTSVIATLAIYTEIQWMELPV